MIFLDTLVVDLLALFLILNIIILTVFVYLER